jgi:hypothetical protein
MKNSIVKALLYCILSVGTFFYGTICVLAGLSLALAGILNALAAIAEYLNRRDGVSGGDMADDASIDERGPSILKFGTF